MTEEYCYSEKFLIYTIRIVERLSQYITHWQIIGGGKGVIFYLDPEDLLSIALINEKKRGIVAVLHEGKRKTERVLREDGDLYLFIAVTKGVIEEWEKI